MHNSYCSNRLVQAGYHLWKILSIIHGQPELPKKHDFHSVLTLWEVQTLKAGDLWHLGFNERILPHTVYESYVIFGSPLRREKRWYFSSAELAGVAFRRDKPLT